MDTKRIFTVEPGLYEVECSIWSQADLGNSLLYANGKNTKIFSSGNIQIDGTKTPDRIFIPDVAVGDDGRLSIEIVADKGLSGDEAAALSGSVRYSRTGDKSGILKSSGDKDEDIPDAFITDNSFEDGGKGWQLGGSVTAACRDGSRALLHESLGTRDSSQLISGLENGYYTLTGRIQNNGGDVTAYLYADDFGGSRAMTALPRSNFPFEPRGAWKKVTVRGIHVTTGQMKVGMFTDSKDAASVIRLDTLRLVKDDKPYRLYMGGDITELSYVEDCGGKFYDENGIQGDAVKLLADNGWNIVRIRIYNNPGKGRGTPSHYIPEGYQDIEDALRLAKRSAEAGMQIQLSFHYSDFWSNPGLQMLPLDWLKKINGKHEEEAVEILADEIYSFTRDALQLMAAQNTIPAFVSLGNETRRGMLIPFGSTSKWDNLAKFYGAGSKAVRESAPSAKIILHLDDGGNTGTYLPFFGEARNRNVDYDVIGSSYYPFWTNKSAAQIAEFCEVISSSFQKPIFLMESGVSFTSVTGTGEIGQLKHNGPYGSAEETTPLLQKEHMDDLFNALKGVKDGMAIGDFYWDPIMIYANGKPGWAINESDGSTSHNMVDNTTLFDFGGKALPVLRSYSCNRNG